MERTVENVWVRVAGHSKRIKARDRFQWRYTLDQGEDQFPIASWHVVGIVTPENFIPGTNPSAEGEKQLLAWIDLYGDLVVDAMGTAYIHLRTPR